MDVFLEQLVKHKKTAADYVKLTLLTVLAAALTLAGLAVNLIYGRYLFGMGYLLIAAIWYFYYLAVQMFNIEYEYILTNSEMDIDKVMSKKGRKNVTSINFKEIEICARANDEEYKAVRERTEGYEKIIDASGSMDGQNVYFVDYHAENGKRRVYFQPTEKMIDAIYKFNPRCVHK